MSLVAGFAYFVFPGPVVCVDLYWTLLIETRLVKPGQDSYPWTVAVDWSPDGGTIVSSGYHNDVFLWDAATGALRRRLKGHRTWVQEAIFSGDGKYLATADWDGMVIVWTASGTRLRKLESKGDLFSLSFHPNKPLIAAGSYEGIVSIFDLDSGEKVKEFSSNKGGTMFIAYSPGGDLLASGGEDTLIHLFETEEYKKIGSLAGHAKGVTSLSFSRDGARLLSSGDDGAIRLWDMKTRQSLRVWKADRDWINFVAFLPDSQRFLTASANRLVQLWHVDGDEPRKVYRLHRDWVQCVRVRADGGAFVTSGKDGLINIWNLERNQLERTIDVAATLKK